MVNRFEDLAPLVAPTGVARGSTVGFRQGVVEAWDPITGANAVRIGGTLFTNLPIIASNTEILLIEPGDVVSIKVVSGNSAWDTMYVEGRVTVPGTPEAAEAIRTGIAQGIRTASNDDFATLALSGWNDLPGSPGPSLAGVPIGRSGTALVIVGAEIGVGGPGAFPSSRYGGMSFEVRDSGNNVVRGATGNRAFEVELAASDSTDVIRVTGASPPVLITGLAPGNYTFTAKYSSESGKEAQFGDRNITVIAL